MEVSDGDGRGNGRSWGPGDGGPGCRRTRPPATAHLQSSRALESVPEAPGSGWRAVHTAGSSILRIGPVKSGLLPWAPRLHFGWICLEAAQIHRESLELGAELEGEGAAAGSSARPSPPCPQSSWTWGPRGQGAILLVNCDRDNPTASSRDCEDEEVLDHGGKGSA